MAGGVLRCSEVARGLLKDSQLLNLSRLLLLFDYIMKHLYDAPSSLLEQVCVFKEKVNKKTLLIIYIIILDSMEFIQFYKSSSSRQR